MKIDGLRTCFLSRFLEEILIFVSVGCIEGISKAVQLSSTSPLGMENEGMTITIIIVVMMMMMMIITIVIITISILILMYYYSDVVLKYCNLPSFTAFYRNLLHVRM